MSTESAVLDLARDIERYALRTKAKKITVTTRPDIAERFQNEEKQLFQILEDRFGIEVKFELREFLLSSFMEALHYIIS